jgi:hypothetical protein
LNGTPITVNTVVAKAQIANLTYAPVADENGNGYVSFQFKVNDGGAYSLTANTITVDVTPVNDAPVITAASSLSLPRNGKLKIRLTDLTVTDIDNTYPTGFSVTVEAGTNYTVVGNDSITSSAPLNTVLSVNVKVSDGAAFSNVFAVSVTVVAPLPTGLFSDISDAKIELYPNPATNYIVVDVPNETLTEAYIYNMTGNLVKTISVKEGKTDISTLSGGVYFIAVNTANGVAVKRFIKI